VSRLVVEEAGEIGVAESLSIVDGANNDAVIVVATSVVVAATNQNIKQM
jgi:hypothetical protein